MKPKQSQVEVVLNLDVDSQNYDQEVAAVRFQKQVIFFFIVLLSYGLMLLHCLGINYFEA